MMASKSCRERVKSALERPLTFHQIRDRTRLDTEETRSALRILLRTHEVLQVSIDSYGHPLYLRRAS